MLVIQNLNEFVGKNDIQSVNDNKYYYEFIQSNNRILIHKKAMDDLCVVESESGAIMVKISELLSVDSILNVFNKL